MTATVLPVDASAQTVTWSVTGTAATIDTNGLLTAVTNGTVTVTASATDTSGITGTKQVTITGQQAAGLSGLTAAGSTSAFANGTSECISYSHCNNRVESCCPTFAAGTVTINGDPKLTTVGKVVDLIPGTNVITITASETNKLDKTYTLTVERAYPYSISTPVLSTTGNIEATAIFTPAGGVTGTATYIFVLMYGSTPKDVISADLDIGSYYNDRKIFRMYRRWIFCQGIRKKCILIQVQILILVMI